MTDSYQIGEAAELLGARVETPRRWEREGKLTATRTSGGQRMVPATEVARLLTTQHTGTGDGRERPNRFPGIVTEIGQRARRHRRVLAGPALGPCLHHPQAADEMGLEPGDARRRTMKATNGMVEVEE